MDSARPIRRDALPNDAAIVASGLSKRFDEVEAVRDVSLRVPPGEVRGLLGPNGAGKSTVLRMLFGLIRPDAGRVQLFGEPVDRSARAMPIGVAGFVETPAFYPYLSGRRNLELLAALDGDGAGGRLDAVIERVGLQDGGRQKVGGYSSGMRQRLGLAASLLRATRLLVVDEPTIGLDPVGARELRGLIRDLPSTGVTVLMSSHNMPEVDEVCDAVTILNGGGVVWDGSVERLRAEASVPAYRVATSDDVRAIDLARSIGGLGVERDSADRLTVSCDQESLDRYVIALGHQGIAVRRLELVMSALESMFFELTGARSTQAEAPPEGAPAVDGGDP